MANKTTDDTGDVGDLYDEIMADIAERAPYANGQEYSIAGPPEDDL